MVIPFSFVPSWRNVLRSNECSRGDSSAPSPLRGVESPCGWLGGSGGQHGEGRERGSGRLTLVPAAGGSAA